MASRLDRLFVLLETGSTVSTRKAAALQLGQVQKLHPHELPHLLSRVHECLKSNSWETRVAAGQAVEAILKQVPGNYQDLKFESVKIDDAPVQKIEDPTVVKVENSSIVKSEDLVVVKVENSTIPKIEDSNNVKVNKESPPAEQPEADCPRPKLTFPTFTLPTTPLLMSSNNLFDATPTSTSAQQRSTLHKQMGLEFATKLGIDTTGIISNEDLEPTAEELSLREVNLQKRRMRKLKSREAEVEEEPVKKAKLEINKDDWLGSWVEILLADLYSTEWEVRHGAGTGLREVMRWVGGTDEPIRQSWLADISLTLVSVLSLDRFGDFLTDQVVAPVRETSAQCLGTIAKMMDADGVNLLVQVLLKMLSQPNWEVRHGGLLGLKYLFAVRGDFTYDLLPKVFEPLFTTLSDTVDDVSAAAAAALSQIATEMGQLETELVVGVLWESLANLDELSSSCNSIMGLLAKVLGSGNNVRPPTTLTPRLYPFLHHTSSSVRRSALLTLQKLLGETSAIELNTTLKHLFQRGLLEHNEDVLQLVPRVWADLLKSTSTDTLLQAACPMIGVWLYLTMQPPRMAIEPQFLMPDTTVGELKKYMSGSSEDCARITVTRFTLGKMLGLLASYIVRAGPDAVDCFARVLLHHLNSRSALQRTVIGMVIFSLQSMEDNLSPHVQALLLPTLLQTLVEPIYFDEIAVSFSKLQSETRDYICTLKHYGVGVDAVDGLLTFEQIELLCGDEFTKRIESVKTKKIIAQLMERLKSVKEVVKAVKREYQKLGIMTLSTLSSAVVSLNQLPAKLNSIVKPLMDSIRLEENELFQQSSALHLCKLIDISKSRESNPVSKIITNLTGFLKYDLDTDVDIISLDGKKNQEESVEARGASNALISIVKYFGQNLPTSVEKLWEITVGRICGGSDETLKALQIFEIISPHFHPTLFEEIHRQLPTTCSLLSNISTPIRHLSSRCLACWANINPSVVMPMVAKEIIPMLESTNVINRRGAIEALWCIVDKLGLELLPYIVLLVVPVLGRMSDQDHPIRLLSSLTFASLVRLMPLEGAVPDPPQLPAELIAQKQSQRLFLENLLNPGSIKEYKINIPINATLRPYQQSGVNWLNFLKTYKLHGILCDDMGLGKTLQTIIIMASEYSDEKSDLPSIVICPPTLTGHWVYEIEKFVSKSYLNPLHYHGAPAERNKLKTKLADHNLIVASYDIVRNDVEWFSSVLWNYCVLDEGHVIKNGKTKISRSIKQLTAKHRLILSGTPIQNNVLELWSLFDFLMPGFLGSEKQFNVKFGRPILLARDAKSSSKDQESGALAMEALHRQALPFLLRRLKEDVLKDLPPKITQDYYCELSPIQQQLYEDFARTRVHQSLNFTPEGHSHIFQALQYLRKVCNHPKLVLTPQHPKYSSIMGQLGTTKELSDINHSAKLPALKQLLLDCGIGSEDQVVNQHRALIFCQLKVMLDILENDLLKVHLPTVTYLRLDGSVPAGQRHSLVTRFNNDPSIDLLLLTTQVGGLGLNLTGADTVIFVEHDWNPMRDLQAMDRAHRIGQKKVVNVYRLITRGTLEEKIMGLQKFKLMTANTVISQENSCIETMATDQLLDLFVLEDTVAKRHHNTSSSDDIGLVGAYKSVLESMPELWEDKLYEEEYDLSGFIKSLGK